MNLCVVEREITPILPNPAKAKAKAMPGKPHTINK